MVNSLTSFYEHDISMRALISKLLLACCAVFALLLPQTALANSNTTTKAASKAAPTKSHTNSAQALADFQSMRQNVRELNYKLIYTNQNDTLITSYQFANFFQDGKRYGELRNLEGNKFSVVLNDGLVIYSNYSLRANNISDFLPNIFNANIDRLKNNYLFTYVGIARVADREAVVYDITNKYTNLFAYQVALDKQTKIPLKVTLFERDLITNKIYTLDNFTATKFEEGIDTKLLSQIKSKNGKAKDVIKNQIDNKVIDSFNSFARFTQIPSGFTIASASEVTLQSANVIIKGKPSIKQQYLAINYNDGLFSFTLNISKNETNSNDQAYWRSSLNTMYTESYAGRNIIIVGQIPVSVAKNIVNSIRIIKNNQIVNTPHPEGYGQRINFK